VLQLLIMMICSKILEGLTIEKNPNVITRLSGGSCKYVTTSQKQTVSEAADSLSDFNASDRPA